MSALVIVDKVSIDHLRCAFGHREAVRFVPRYPPGSGSSCDIIGIWVCDLLGYWRGGLVVHSRGPSCV